MENILKIGDIVNWRDVWGKAPAKEATIKELSISYNGDGFGCEFVNEVDWSLVADGRRVIANLTNGSWAYGYQLDQIK
jgi:hypothetical protein